MAALTLAACSPGAPQKNDVKPADGSPLVVEEVIITSKGKNSEPLRSALSPGQPLVLSIRMSRNAKNSTMETKVFALATGQVKEKRAERFEKDAQTTELELDDAKSWPAGRYLVEIRLDGKLAVQHEFDLTEMLEKAPNP
jgi:hypothetical protein